MLRIALLISLLTATPSTLAQEASSPPLPQPRPENLGDEAPLQASDEENPAADAPGSNTVEPEIERAYQSVCPALLSGRIIATHLEPIRESGCSVASPISVSAIIVGERRIILSGTPVLTCGMATSLADWATQVDAYADAVLDNPIEILITGPGYQCRLRNNAETGFISEHGLGNAVDISAITLADGMRVSILEDWSASPRDAAGKFLAYGHGAACAEFTTVLGPTANSAHADHFHFDLGCHGQSCTARICE